MHRRTLSTIFRIVAAIGAAKVLGISASTVRGYLKDACEFLRPLFLDVAPSASSRSLRPKTI